MVEIDRILSNIANMTHDLTSSIQRKYPINLVSDMISSVEKINIDLKNHRQFLTLGHLNTVSIPLHKDKIYRVLKKLILIFLECLRPISKKVHLKTCLIFLAINCSI